MSTHTPLPPSAAKRWICCAPNARLARKLAEAALGINVEPDDEEDEDDE